MIFARLDTMLSCSARRAASPAMQSSAMSRATISFPYMYFIFEPTLLRLIFRTNSSFFLFVVVSFALSIFASWMSFLFRRTWRWVREYLGSAVATENGRTRADFSYKYVNPKIHYYIRGICDENGLPYKEKLSRFQLWIRKMQTYAAR